LSFVFDFGYQMGRLWAAHEASEEQILRIQTIEDGRNWMQGRVNPIDDLRQLIDPDKGAFLELDEPPPPEFVAGFIDGAKSPE